MEVGDSNVAADSNVVADSIAAVGASKVDVSVISCYLFERCLVSATACGINRGRTFVSIVVGKTSDVLIIDRSV